MTNWPPRILPRLQMPPSYRLGAVWRHGRVIFRVLRAEGVEPRHEHGKLVTPIDLTAHVEIAEHAGRSDGADIEMCRIGRRLGEGHEAAHHLAALVVEP